MASESNLTLSLAKQLSLTSTAVLHDSGTAVIQTSCFCPNKFINYIKCILTGVVMVPFLSDDVIPMMSSVKNGTITTPLKKAMEFLEFLDVMITP